MTSKAKHTAIVLGGAIALASGAYALGTQTGDGTASAGSKAATSSAQPRPGLRHDRFRTGFRPALDDLAAKLGVKTADLRTALMQVKTELAPPDRGDKLSGLADALGVSQSKLEAALQKLRPERGERHERRGDFAKALAAKLGVSAAEVRKAFAAHWRGPHSGADIAKALGVSEAKLKQAFEALKGRREDDIAAKLAKELGLSTSKVQAAFDKLRSTHEAEHRKLEDEFASKLAAKLNLDVSKVKSALEEFGPHRHP
jgi:biotin operon repressor